VPPLGQANRRIADGLQDIDEVMESSKELVKVDHRLKQIVNVKGD
jgi:hypothetical protein